MSRKVSRILSLVLLLTLLAGCASGAAEETRDEPVYGEVAEENLVELPDDGVAMSSAPNDVLTPDGAADSPNVLEVRNGKAVIDYSNTGDGYVMVQYTAPTDKRLKARVEGPTTTYTYDLTQGERAVLPLSDGNGSYQVTVFENTTGNKYAAVLSTRLEVVLSSEFAPFLHPNQYVNYSDAPNTVAKAEELIGSVEDPLEKIAIVYNFVVSHLTYDSEKAATVQSGYLPALDTVLEEKTGICFDYAALMAAMLRSQGVPCKLVVGYAGDSYHAWVSVWSEKAGWVDGAGYLEGGSWQRMDPTFASSAHQSGSILKYIGDGTNYTAKYFY